MKNVFIALILVLTASVGFSQYSIRTFNIDTSKYPTASVRAKIYDAKGLPVVSENTIKSIVSIYDETNTPIPYGIDSLKNGRTSGITVVLVLDATTPNISYMRTCYLRLVRNLFNILDGRDQLIVYSWGDSLTLKYYFANLFDTTKIINSINDIQAQNGFNIGAVYKSSTTNFFKELHYNYVNNAERYILYVGGGDMNDKKCYNGYAGSEWETEIPNEIKKYNFKSYSIVYSDINAEFGNNILFATFSKLQNKGRKIYTQILKENIADTLGNIQDIVDFEFATFETNWNLATISFNVNNLSIVHSSDNDNFYSTITFGSSVVSFDNKTMSVQRRKPLDMNVSDITSSKIVLYPNPTVDNFIINDVNNSIWNIYNNNGIYIMNVQSNIKINHSLISGNYIAINTKGNSIKFIVK